MKTNNLSNSSHDGKEEPVEQNRDVNALFSSFRLDQNSYRTFNRHRIPKVQELPETKKAESTHQGRVHVGIFSPMGGSGKSTFTASLGSILWQLGRRVLLVDTSPWHSLAFHYGAADVRLGKRSFFAPGAQDLPVHILSWDHSDAGVPDLNGFSATTPLDCVLFDLGGVAGDAMLSFFRECDVLIVPLLPDPSAVRLAEALKTLLEKSQPFPKPIMFVVNQMDDSSLAKEVHERLTQSLGDQLLPSPIFRQLEIQQALADGVVLPIDAPDAQAVSIFNQIAQWLKVPEAAAQIQKQQRWSER